MNDHCTFYKEHKCIKWADYELLRYELEEANEVYFFHLYPFSYVTSFLKQKRQ